MPGLEAWWFDYYGSVELLLFIYSLGGVRYEELSVLVNMKSEPTIVSAGFQKNLAECTRPGSFAAWYRMCVRVT